MQRNVNKDPVLNFTRICIGFITIVAALLVLYFTLFENLFGDLPQLRVIFSGGALGLVGCGFIALSEKTTALGFRLLLIAAIGILVGFLLKPAS